MSGEEVWSHKSNDGLAATNKLDNTSDLQGNKGAPKNKELIELGPIESNRPRKGLSLCSLCSMFVRRFFKKRMFY